jgi:hypothetical protein
MVSEIVYELPDGKYGLAVALINGNADYTSLQIIGTELQVVYHISALSHVKQCEFNLDNVKMIYMNWFINSYDEDDFETNLEGDIIIFHNSNEFHVNNWYDLHDAITKSLAY